MSDALILEFRNASPEVYHAVNAILGIDPVSGAGDWPAGMISHSAGEHADGQGLTIFEVWDSRDSQGAFMSARLGPAMAQAQVPEPTRMEWFSLAGHHSG